MVNKEVAGNAQDIMRLFDLDDETLFARAGEVAAKFPGTVKSAPLILTGNCTTRPICRHCKWEYFKIIEKSPFILDQSKEEILVQAHRLVEEGIDRAFFGTGWMGYEFPLRFLRIIEAVRSAEPALELYGLFGALSKRSHHDLAHAGLDGMLTSLESPSEEVYRSFRPGGDSLADRLRSLEYCQESSLAIWTGFLVGLGESLDDVAHGIKHIQSFNPESVSILPFVPFPGTAMESHPAADLHRLARINAAARISLIDTPYFFYDCYEGFGNVYASKIGLNGSYEVQEKSNEIVSQNM